MNVPAATFIRLLGALEDLAAQEATQLAGEDYAALRQTQERAAPLVTELARLGGAAVSTAVRPRLEALLARRQQNQERLADRVACVRDALLRTQVHQRRAGQVAPAYGGGRALGGSLRQLSALG
jgi:hypothetical protein